MLTHNHYKLRYISHHTKAIVAVTEMGLFLIQDLWQDFFLMCPVTSGSSISRYSEDCISQRSLCVKERRLKSSQLHTRSITLLALSLFFLRRKKYSSFATTKILLPRLTGVITVEICFYYIIQQGAWIFFLTARVTVLKFNLNVN